MWSVCHNISEQTILFKLLLQTPGIHFGLTYWRTFSCSFIHQVSVSLGPQLWLPFTCFSHYSSFWESQGSALAKSHVAGECVTHSNHPRERQEKRRHHSQSPQESPPPTPPPELGHIHAWASHRGHRKMPAPLGLSGRSGLSRQQGPQWRRNGFPEKNRDVACKRKKGECWQVR